MDEIPCIVLDNGSGSTKVGIAGEDVPNSVFPTCIGYLKDKADQNSKEYYFGNDAESKAHILNMHYPVQNGIIQDWEGMEKIWAHIWKNEIRMDSNTSNVMFCEPLSQSISSKEKVLEVFFEDYQVPRFISMSNSRLSLMASGRVAGLVIESGDQVTSVSAINEQTVSNFNLIDLGGRDLTYLFREQMKEKGYNFRSNYELNIVKNMKEKVSYVALDFETELEYFKHNPSSKEKTYELPNGECFTIGDQQIRCPEAIFQPEIIGKTFPGIQQNISNVINSTDVDKRQELYSNVLISGGNTLFRGIYERLQKEINMQAPLRISVKIVAPSDRGFGTFIGGSIMGSLTAYEQFSISLKDYNERGATHAIRAFANTRLDF